MVSFGLENLIKNQEHQVGANLIRSQQATLVFHYKISLWKKGTSKKNVLRIKNNILKI